MTQRKITSRNNPDFKRLHSLASAHGRLKSSTFLIEGPKFIKDALNAGMKLVSLVVSEGYNGAVPDTDQETDIFFISKQLFKNISDTASPQGLIGEAKRRWSKVEELLTGRKHLLVAWGVQDPGNIGTIIRSSSAFKMGGLIIGRGSADPFSQKAIRASAGFALTHPLARASQLQKLVHALDKNGYCACWTGPKAGIPLREVGLESPLAVFIGSEGRGFSGNDQSVIGRGIHVPIASGVESLNAGVTGSIVAYELSQKSLHNNG